MTIVQCVLWGNIWVRGCSRVRETILRLLTCGLLSLGSSTSWVWQYVLKLSKVINCFVAKELIQPNYVIAPSKDGVELTLAFHRLLFKFVFNDWLRWHCLKYEDGQRINQGVCFLLSCPQNEPLTRAHHEYFAYAGLVYTKQWHVLSQNVWKREKHVRVFPIKISTRVKKKNILSFYD